MAFPILGSFIPEVRFNLGNRTDLDDKISLWLRDAYYEIAMGYPLETLELTVENATVAGIDTYDYPDNARGLKALTLMNGRQPVNIVKKNIQVVRRYQINTPGIPSIWAPFGNSFIMRATPNGNYPLIIDYWQTPNIAPDESDTGIINDTETQLPADWFEILKQSATQKGHNDLQEADKAQAVRQMLNGDSNSSKGWPGMIKERLNRNASENSLSDYGLRPRVRRYTSTK